MENNLEMAKRISEVLEDSDLPPIVQSQAVMGAMLGASSDTIVRGMAETLSAMETQEAEVRHPEPKRAKGYTQVERELVGVLTENTGAHILDSGGAYGRAWQRNRDIEDFRKLPKVEVVCWKDGEVDLSISVFHYLNAFLEIDDDVRRLRRMFSRFERKPENKDKGWLEIMEEFADYLRDKHGYFARPTFNTYNNDSLLSQVLQGICFGEDEDDESPFILLQIHGGCDVRGGYTKPKLFRINDISYFAMAETELDATCTCHQFYTDDCGYHWYDNDSNDRGMPDSWKPQPKVEDPKDWEYKLVCQACGKDVEFYARLEY